MSDKTKILLFVAWLLACILLGVAGAFISRAMAYRTSSESAMRICTVCKTEPVASYVEGPIPYTIRCEQCGAAVHDETEFNVDAWNRRQRELVRVRVKVWRQLTD